MLKLSVSTAIGSSGDWFDDMLSQVSQVSGQKLLCEGSSSTSPNECPRLKGESALRTVAFGATWLILPGSDGWFSEPRLRNFHSSESSAGDQTWRQNCLSSVRRRSAAVFPAEERYWRTSTTCSRFSGGFCESFVSMKPIIIRTIAVENVASRSK